MSARRIILNSRLFFKHLPVGFTRKFVKKMPYAGQGQERFFDLFHSVPGLPELYLHKFPMRTIDPQKNRGLFGTSILWMFQGHLVNGSNQTCYEMRRHIGMLVERRRRSILQPTEGLNFSEAFG